MTRRLSPVARLWRDALRGMHIARHQRAAVANGDIARDEAPGSLRARCAALARAASLCRVRAWEAVARGDLETARIYASGSRDFRRQMHAAELAR